MNQPSSTADKHSRASFCGYIVYSRKRFKIIPKEKVFLNKNTPVGEPAEFWEKLPHGGRREFSPVFKVVDGRLDHCYEMIHGGERKRWEYKMTPDLVAFLEDKKICIPEVCGGSETHLVLPDH